MHDIRNLSERELVDMLSKQTTKLTSLLVELFKNNEYIQCKELINALTNEIEIRKKYRNNQTQTVADPFSRNK
jgi:ribosomal protein S8